MCVKFTILIILKKIFLEDDTYSYRVYMRIYPYFAPSRDGSEYIYLY